MKILIVTPWSRDASSYWRCIGPMSYLAKNSGGDIDIDVFPEKTIFAWDYAIQYDLIFMHRPCRNEDLIIMRVARNLGIPVWVDYDDWLFGLPEWNPHLDSYHNPNTQQLMAHVLACADVVSCTTSALAQAFTKVNKQVVIVPNAYRSDLFPWRQTPPPKREVTFVWRGTNTHDGDLYSVMEGLKNLPDKLHTFGTMPYVVIKDSGTEFVQIPHQDVILYWQKLYDLKPKFMLFPLQDNFFNHCKSNIAWIESCHAGALTVAPDLPEWRQPGVHTYKPGDSQSFREAVDVMAALTPEQHEEQANLAFEAMKAKYDISVVNQIRINICKAMLAKDFVKNTHSPYDQGIAMMAMSILKGKEK